MDVEEFIEQDILVFLDKELDSEEETDDRPVIEPNAFLTRDYEKEFFHAIDENNVTKAKRVLHDLKQKFDECPSGTPQKQQLKMLLTDLYEKFKDHLDAQDTFAKMDAQLSSFGRPSVPAPQKPLAKKANEPVPKPVANAPKAPPPNEPPQEKPDLAAHANELLDKAEAQLSEHALQEAMRTYRLARKDILGMEKVPSRLAVRFSGVFERIKRLAQHEKQPPQETKTDPDAPLLAQLQRQKRELDAFLQQRDIPGAMRTCEAMDATARKLRGKTATQTRAKLAQVREIVDTLGKREKNAQRRRLDKNLVLHIEREKKTLDRQLQGSDLTGAMRTYARMKALVPQLSDRQLAETVAKKLVRIFTIISQIRKHKDDRNLARSIP